MLAIAALLWFVYLVPSWLRRREYFVAERSAVRLQQRINAMAHSAEVDEVVRVESTTRRVRRHPRWRDRDNAVLSRRDVARVEPTTTRGVDMEMRVEHSQRGSLAEVSALRRRRIRRTRRMASALMLVATVVVGVQGWLMATTGMSVGAWLVLAGAVAIGGVAIVAQRRLDARSVPRVSVAGRSRPAVQVAELPVEAVAAPWTPVQVPRPLYLSDPAPRLARQGHELVDRVAAGAETASMSRRGSSTDDPVESLRAASVASVDALRAAQSDSEVPQLRPSAAASSRYARMGVLGPDATEVPDVDAALRRRRRAG